MRELLEEWRPRIDATIEEVLPRTIDEAYLADFFGPATYEYDAQAIQEALANPVWNLLDRGGKRWRAVVLLQIIEGLGEAPEPYLPYAIIPEILHNGTIIVDDVEDEARLRRGEPALHHVYGEDVALNAGNALYFIPLKIITHNPADLDPAERLAMYEMLMHELNRTHLGQGMDIYWHNLDDISVRPVEYLEMTACKTGCLARIVARLASIITEQPPAVEEELAAYAESLAIAFQIGDDILDIESTIDGSEAFGKSFGNDIREGKKTLMAIHAARKASQTQRDRLATLLAAEENSDEEIREVIDIYREHDSIAFARSKALELAGEARSHLAAVDLQDEPAERLERFTRFVVEREV